MDLESHLRRLTPIHRLAQGVQDKAIALAEIRSFERGQIIYRQGDSDDHVHYLLAGTVELIWHDKVTRRISATHKVALRPIDPSGRKRYTVRAADRSTVAIFKRIALDRLVEQFETVTEETELEVSEIATARSSDWMIRMLQSELFSVLPATNIQKIFARMEQIAFAVDDAVVRQGALGEHYYAMFLLGERGFTVEYLDTPIAQIVTQHPTFATRQGTHPHAATEPAEVVSFPGAEMVYNELSESERMDGHNDDGPLENTITRIADLYSHQEAKRDMNDTTPVEQYADTATGQALADVIDELSEQHDSLAERQNLSGAMDEMDRDASASDAYANGTHDILRDGISAVIQEMESKLRSQVALAIEARTADLEADYRDKVNRMCELTNQEIKQKEVALHHALEAEQNEKEQLLRSYYKKLIAFANKISKQKAQLQEAKKQFESKLKSANQLYREIEEMRELLTQQIGYLDQDAMEEMPKLSISL